MKNKTKYIRTSSSPTKWIKYFKWYILGVVLFIMLSFYAYSFILEIINAKNQELHYKDIPGEYGIIEGEEGWFMYVTFIDTIYTDTLSCFLFEISGKETGIIEKDSIFVNCKSKSFFTNSNLFPEGIAEKKDGIIYLKFNSNKGELWKFVRLIN